MAHDSESIDDVLFSSDTATTERKPGKFSPNLHGGNTLKPVASSSKPPAAPESINAEEVLPTDQGSSLKDAFIFCGMDLLGEDVQPALKTASTAGRFQPKTKLNPKAKKPVARPDAASTRVKESIRVPIPDSSNSAPHVGSSESNVMQDPLHTTEEPVHRTKVLRDGSNMSEGDTSLQADPEMPTTETTTAFDRMEVFEDTVFQPSSTYVPCCC